MDSTAQSSSYDSEEIKEDFGNWAQWPIHLKLCLTATGAASKQSLSITRSQKHFLNQLLISCFKQLKYTTKCFPFISGESGMSEALRRNADDNQR